jgi:hypothetical protein
VHFQFLYLLAYPSQAFIFSAHWQSSAIMANTTETFGSSTSPSESSRQSRIHFPADDPSPSRLRHFPPETPPKTSPLAFRSSPVRRNSPLNPQATAFTVNARRRVRSVDTVDVFLDTNHPRRTPAISLIAPSRGMNSLAQRKPDVQSQEDAVGLGIFSDEYDLCK